METEGGVSPPAVVGGSPAPPPVVAGGVGVGAGVGFGVGAGVGAGVGVGVLAGTAGAGVLVVAGTGTVGDDGAVAATVPAPSFSAVGGSAVTTFGVGTRMPVGKIAMLFQGIG